MKRSFLVTLIAMIMLVSCQKQDNLAQQNVKKHLIEKIDGKGKFSFEKFSKLYIISPKDKSNIPKADENSQYEMLEWMNLFSSGLRLSLKGCCQESLKYIIDNDAKFNKFKTGGNKFAMICFFNFEDKFKNVTDMGVCAVLDSVYNVSQVYSIEDVKSIRNMIENEK